MGLATAERFGGGGRLFDAQMLENPYPVYAELRASDPVHWDDDLQAWVLTRYHDAALVLNDRRFSSQRLAAARRRFPQAELTPLFDTLSSRMSEQDEPDHKRLRALVHDAFIKTSVDKWTPAIQARVEKLLEAGANKGKLEFISDVAIPLPLFVILEIVGVPAEDRDQIKTWCDDFAVVALNAYAGISSQAMTAGLHSTMAFRDYLSHRVAELESNPQSDLLSALIEAEHEGSRLSLEELLANVLLLLSAGNETTTCLLGNGLAALLEHPDQLQRLRDEPALIPNAVEEFLRYDAPVQFMGRIATEDVEVGDKLIRRNEMVLAVLGAANRDPGQFPDPDRLDVTRPHVHHLAFGHGPHFCAGAQLSRLEAKLMFTTLLERFTRLELDAGQQLLHRDNFNIRCLRELPISVTP